MSAGIRFNTSVCLYLIVVLREREGSWEAARNDQERSNEKFGRVAIKRKRWDGQKIEIRLINGRTL